MVCRSNGIFIVSGPPGSGKSTTLHAILAHLNKDDRKIWTAEEQLEIRQDGLRQVQLDPGAGWTFAAALRSFLRADPDVIMVSEMRDEETAQAAVEASLTGHAVFSTLDAGGAVESVLRVLEMGVQPVNFADSLLGVLSQRLVRRLCAGCRAAEPGCGACGGTGYRGRIALHELFVNTPEAASLIHRGAGAGALREIAVQGGMRTLMQDGIEKCLRGLTDLEEVRGACA